MVQTSNGSGTKKAPFDNAAAGGEPMEWLDGDKRFVPEGTKVGAPDAGTKKPLPDWAITPEGMD